MSIPLYQVDAFTSEPFAGNPAAVCVLDHEAVTAGRGPRVAWMQNVAAEMNLAETAFVLPMGGAGRDQWNLRWFTPVTEVALCGHATLASAHVLWETGRVEMDVAIRFQTRESGVLICGRRDGWITLDFPADAPEPAAPPEGLLAALGVEAAAVQRGRFDWLVEVADENALRQCRPNFAELGAIDTRGVIVTAPADAAHRDDYQFASRFFAPTVGIDEDPVTGSAHCTLAPYWAGKLGRADMTARQISRRGGTIRLHHLGDRVELAGQAVTMLVGELVAG